MTTDWDLDAFAESVIFDRASIVAPRIRDVAGLFHAGQPHVINSRRHIVQVSTWLAHQRAHEQ